MVSTGQRADCSKAACRIVENLGERYKGLDLDSGRGWRRKSGLPKHGRTLIRCGSKEGRRLPHREMAQKMPPWEGKLRMNGHSELDEEERKYGVVCGVREDSISVCHSLSFKHPYRLRQYSKTPRWQGDQGSH